VPRTWERHSNTKLRRARPEGREWTVVVFLQTPDPSRPVNRYFDSRPFDGFPQSFPGFQRVIVA